MRIFVAGATGAVGLPLVRALCTLGHQVTGMTRAGPGVDRLREVGAAASLADAFDPQAVRDAIGAAAPDIVVDPLTWLPANPAEIIKALPNDTRLHRNPLILRPWLASEMPDAPMRPTGSCLRAHIDGVKIDASPQARPQAERSPDLLQARVWDRRPFTHARGAERFTGGR